MAVSDFKWFVIKTRAGKELKVRDRLVRLFSDGCFSSNIQQVVVPMEKYIRLHDGKRVVKEKVCYSGYVFLHAKLDGELEEAIEKGVVDVIGFLREGKSGSTIPLRTAEVNRMLKDIDARSNDETDASLSNYFVNERIKIVDGPFNNFYGVIEEVMEDKKKLRVNVKIFGRQTPVELNYLQVEKVDSSDSASERPEDLVI